MKFKSKKTRNVFMFFLFTAALTIFFIWQNNDMVVTSYEYVNSKIPEEFNGYTVVHVSDLHNKDYKERLSGTIEKVDPDIIVITGDLIDAQKTRVDIAMEFIGQIKKIAPVYLVSGNHEQSSGIYDVLKEQLEGMEVRVIDNSYLTLKRGGFEIGILGIADPSAAKRQGKRPAENSSRYIKSRLEELLVDVYTDFNILLSHRPEHFRIYKEMGIDLVFSGHAHGGQIRVPFVGGLVAPNQGLFPKYTEGVHSEGATSMVVSRGLGNSVFPLRIFNRPELVVVNIKRRYE